MIFSPLYSPFLTSNIVGVNNKENGKFMFRFPRAQRIISYLFLEFFFFLFISFLFEEICYCLVKLRRGEWRWNASRHVIKMHFLVLVCIKNTKRVCFVRFEWNKKTRANESRRKILFKRHKKTQKIVRKLLKRISSSGIRKITNACFE